MQKSINYWRVIIMVYGNFWQKTIWQNIFTKSTIWRNLFDKINDTVNKISRNCTYFSNPSKGASLASFEHQSKFSINWFKFPILFGDKNLAGGQISNLKKKMCLSTY